MSVFTGSGVALVTPMKKDGSVDYQKLDELVEWQVNEGINAIVTCGTTGEASTLDDEEHISVIEAVVDKVNKRVPVVAGTGSNNTQHGIHLAKEAERVGADALLVVTPYYNKATKKSIIAHYKAICDTIELPVILYSVASRTGMNLDYRTVKELKQIPNIVGIKEASADIAQIVEIAQLVDENFALYSGNDDQVLPLLAVGGSGVISTISNILPKETATMVRNFLEGNIAQARATQLKQLPLIQAVFSEVNPVPIKAAVSLLGKCELSYRLPLAEPEEETLTNLKTQMTKYGLL
ncbi:4-hydroxy-tetrahydrodipicolinate synthase [Tetragenococcus halophilus]|uniref:4-hydroxy-tetrahydrodipicolinate synthase n=2 Tax=Tetragenococcus halophilus TaxID=51669 RepID=A0A2H6CUX9_TETHA|nr:4-hydroxy-tetrahydrodipicolinate synthase [Tetragenococcus halophilus]AYW51236.1 4-hydroxy-tetrahydrodipicolinate synthase [Tetragenococcus halophilus]MCF1600969.1 4-hydroxy-tetrahydrodipicolinate synthase [Tetragenococcus halophilus]MCF1674817.1 4-hydroxy-tetrahydrodipicolinate synthase [Tetragenococcus halophilus]MCO8285932.1 4-hydroxy-tetrahydrodipicolinate synthase [Tetragenococcus halophilus]MCO8288094.1 4-hydroxy-tetrahydrodipicolinate synthase [Tetragenococcus halophilus]